MARGYIERRGDESWRIIYETGRTINGKRDRRMKTIKVKTQREAEKALSRFISEIESGLKTDDDDMRFAKFIEIWKSDYAEEQLAPKTYDEYQKYLKFRILPALGKFKLKDISDKILRQFYRTLKEASARRDKKAGSLAARTILHYHMLLSAILEKAVKWGYLAYNPAKKVERPKVAKHQIKAYDEPELSRLITALEKAPLKYRTIIYIAISTGLRRGEIIGLDWKDIDFENGTLLVNKSSQYIPGKGVFIKDPKNEHSIRRVTLSPSALKLLQTFQELQSQEREKAGSIWNESDKVFVTWNGQLMSPDTVTKWFKKFLKKEGLPHVQFHSMRHSSASIAAAMGVDIKTVSTRLGHASIQTTMDIYGHSTANADRNAAEKLDRILNIDKKEDK